MDSRARKNLNNINTELQDVHRIMVQNIDDVLQRGETLSGNLSCHRTHQSQETRASITPLVLHQ